jgi:hypothetical protein
MGGLVILGLLIALAMLAPRYGADWRDGADWRRPRGRSLTVGGTRFTPRADAAALARWLRRVARRVARAWNAQERAWDALWLAHQPWRQDDGRWPGGPGRRTAGQDEPGAGERGRHPDELRWRRDGDAWYLDGRLLPSSPAAGDPSGAHRD